MVVPLVLLVVVALRGIQGEISGRFDKRIPSTTRGIKNESLVVPCGVSRLEQGEKVIWRNVDANQKIESGDRVTVTEDEGVWNLHFNPLLEIDAGTYECVILEGVDEKSIYFTLTVLEPSENLSWRSSLECGEVYDQGRRFTWQCDAEGSYPCCGSRGVCGYSKAECECFICVDYRKNDTSEEPYFEKPDLTTVRTKVGANDVTLPCTVWNHKTDMRFRKVIGPNKYKTLIRFGRSHDPRVVLQITPSSGSDSLKFYEVRKSDEGIYQCYFTQNDKFYMKEINLIVLDEGEQTLWNTNLWCGRKMLLQNTTGVSRFIKEPCDPLGSYPCCSDRGGCGFTVTDCECKDCIDYRLYDPLWQNCAANGSFQCDINKCINSFKQCDGVYDCEDGMDEKNCQITGVFNHNATIKLNGTIGQPFTLPCQIVNLGRYETVNWRRVCDDKPLPHVNVTDLSVDIAYNFWNLTFTNVSTSHVGNYSCEIRTETGVSRNIYSCDVKSTLFSCQEVEDFSLTSQRKCGLSDDGERNFSKFGEISGRFDERIPSTTRGIKNESLVVPCGVSRLEPGDKVIWRNVDANQIIESDDRVTVTEDEGVWNLHFNPLLESDAGTYECVILEGVDEKKKISYPLIVLDISFREHTLWYLITRFSSVGPAPILPQWQQVQTLQNSMVS